MKLAASLCSLSVAFLLLGANLTASLSAAPTPSETVQADAPASHTAFTVQVVGKGRPLLLIPGLTCPGAVWDETVAHY